MSFFAFVILSRRRRIPIFHGILRCAQNDKAGSSLFFITPIIWAGLAMTFSEVSSHESEVHSDKRPMTSDLGLLALLTEVMLDSAYVCKLTNA
jgi:hypothetical protein